ncbi:unnamed protein product [Cuscuta epithymum]|uniref:Uncharacterized protein n=1 Tax=Cuscuta epithymum TaxID=186058 RepID=A0AAV0CKQ1_9ASTE|nr:unnamed protein product [Cuscuta epithymum]
MKGILGFALNKCMEFPYCESMDWTIISDETRKFLKGHVKLSDTTYDMNELCHMLACAHWCFKRYLKLISMILSNGSRNLEFDEYRGGTSTPESTPSAEVDQLCEIINSRFKEVIDIF